MKKFAKDHIILTMFLTLVISLILIVLIIFLLRRYNMASWDAISSVGEWASILVAVLIPIAVIYIEKQVEKNTNEVEEKKNEIKISNTTLYDEINILKQEINSLKFSTKTDRIPIKEVNLKEEIYKFICISMITTTKDIMNKFDIDLDQTKSILLELSRVDNLIKPAFIVDDPDNENCHWQKKK